MQHDYEQRSHGYEKLIVECTLDEQQCQQECEYKSDRLKCPFIKTGNMKKKCQHRFMKSKTLPYPVCIRCGFIKRFNPLEYLKDKPKKPQ